MGHVDTRMTSLVYRHRLNPVVNSTAGPMESIFGSGSTDAPEGVGPIDVYVNSIETQDPKRYMES